MRELKFPSGFRLTVDMKKAIERNAQQDEHLTTVVQQLDREKRAAFNQLTEKREAFVRETAKRRLSLPAIGKTIGSKEVLLDRVRRKASSVDEGKSVFPSIRLPGQLLVHPNLHWNGNINSEERKRGGVSLLANIDNPPASRHVSNSIADAERESASVSIQSSDIGRLLSLKIEEEEEEENLVQAQQWSYKPRNHSISVASWPPSNDVRILKRRATLHHI